MEFCKQYNAATEDRRGQVIPVEITIYEDRSFTFVLKTPPTTVLLREAAGLEKASSAPGRTEAGKVTEADLERIAQIKLADLNTDSLEEAKAQIAGTARSMGLAVVS
jgi:large subunit ribosomal protein L11